MTEVSLETPRLSAWQKTMYSLPQVGINLMGVMVAQWLTFYYRPPDGDSRPALVGAGVFAILMLVGRAVDGVTDPLVGHWSDRARTRFGRRMPFIVLGTPALALSFAALWFPPDATATLANTLYLGATLVLYWIAFTVVVGPYYALLPEIARGTQERVRLSSVMALFIAVGTVVGGIGVGLMGARYPNGITLFGWHVQSGIQIFGLVSAVITAATFVLLPLGIRETTVDESKAVDASLIESLKTAFQNPAFRCFLGLSVFVQLGTLTFVTGLPYLATTILEAPGMVISMGPMEWVVPFEDRIIGPGGGEMWTGTLQTILFGVALLSLPLVNWLAGRVGKNRLMILAGWAFAVVLTSIPLATLLPDPTVAVLVMVVLLGFPASCALVLVNAIAADVVDYDEERTGMRREGIYSGASSLIAKTAQGLGPAIVVGLLAWLGSSRGAPWGILMTGPVSGALIAMGMLIFRRTPIKDDVARG